MSTDGNRTVALYGLGTETERFIAEHGKEYNIVGLLDGFRTDGEIYGYPIITLDEALQRKALKIIVVARPGSCKAITKRIGGFCEKNGIELFDVRGNDLLAPVTVTYDFSAINGNSIADLKRKIDGADVVSFDLLDTLVARRVYSYTDIFELVDIRLHGIGIDIPDFTHLRLSAEKELSKERSPKLVEIYEEVLKRSGVDTISAEELANIEWSADIPVMIRRDKVCNIMREAADLGKSVVITSDCYYGKDQLGHLLDVLGITGYEKMLVSSEYGTLKTQELFDELITLYPDKRILHIGDDETADIVNAAAHGIDTFRLYGGIQLFDALGGLGLEKHMHSLSDRVKTGMFIARIFNDPFVFEDSERRLCVDDAKNIGYLFCAPMITDFVHWMRDEIKEDGIGEILFGARDGYLLEKLYRMIDPETDAIYFMTSRTAAIRAGMENEEDIAYVEAMKYSGPPEEALKVRFGIEATLSNDTDMDALILEKAKQQRNNYRRYISKLGIGKVEMAFFDFVAKGTTQMYLQKVFAEHMKGFYFLQLEPEFMADKGLDIEPFYSDEEKDKSAIFDNYYILETVLTAPHPQMLEMDDDGEPVYAKDTRSDRDLAVFEKAQSGIIDFFRNYTDIVPESVRVSSKELDEILLSLVNRVRILDEDFLSVKVEDPFFGRMTDIRDVIG